MPARCRNVSCWVSIKRDKGSILDFFSKNGRGYDEDFMICNNCSKHPVQNEKVDVFDHDFTNSKGN